MSRRRGAAAGLLVVAVAALLVGLLSAPSQAEPKKLLVSSSATGPFRDNLATPLFDDAGPFVPLDEASSTFYVKNNSKQTARATLAVVNRGGTNEFEDALTFDVDIDGTTTTSTVPAPGSPGCSLVLTGPSIAPGAVQGIDLSLSVADLQGRAGTDQAASLDFVVTLSQIGPKGQVKVCGEQATAQPEVKGAQGNGSGNGSGDGSGDGSGNGQGDGGDAAADCDRDVVVTVAGAPTCVPTAVDAGGDAPYGGGEPRSPQVVLGLVLVVLGAGAVLVGWLNRRRRTQLAASA